MLLAAAATFSCLIVYLGIYVLGAPGFVSLDLQNYRNFKLLISDSIIARCCALLCFAAFVGCGSISVSHRNDRKFGSGIAPGLDASPEGGAPKGNPVAFNSASTCGTSYAPGRVNIHLLSTDEYNNSTADLLFTSTKGSDAAVFEAAPKGPTGSANDTNNFALTALSVSKYWEAATVLAAEVVASKGKVDGAFAKVALCAVNQPSVDQNCYRSVVKSLGMRAWRRPLTAGTVSSEVERLLAIMNTTSSFDDALVALIQALLISPHFLFVSITSAESTTDGAIFALNQFQLASRLSYFIWRTMPDTELFNLASAGSLATTAAIAAQVDRMLKDERSQRVANSMLNDWVGADKIVDMVTPGLGASLKQAMIHESQLLLQDLVRGDRSLINVTSAKYSYMNRELAGHYGLAFSGPDPARFARIDLAASPRTGVLSHGAFLLATAGSTTETRPVKRGNALAGQWICADIPPPPADVPKIDLSALSPNATPREMLAVHTKSASCAGCHQVLDPLGLGFESFDSFGKWRTSYPTLGNAAIDSSGSMPDGFAFQGTEALLGYLATNKQVKSCLSRKMMEMALMRVTKAADDKCVNSFIGQQSFNADSKLSDVMKGIVLSRQFGLQTGESP